jgi:hypothetical protein
VQSQLAAWFGLDSASVTEQAPFETFVEADAHAKATYNAHELLGATPEPSRGKSGGWAGKGSSKASGAGTGASSSSSQEETKQEAHPHADLLQQLAEAESKGAIARLYVTNKEAWSHPDVEAAAKKRSAEL